MKKLMFALAATAAVFAQAEEAKKEEVKSEGVSQAEANGLMEDTVSRVWGFTSWGVLSGYQLYGNLVNCEPVIQSYSELNFNLPADLGHVGAAAFMNNDLTGQRSAFYRRAFNEMDPMVHWQKTFWFNEDQTWGLDYRNWFCWYIYPDSSTHTTMDWDHTFSLVNPYVTPYITWVHEYFENANLIEFGLNRKTQITDAFSITPSANFVWREAQYYWCFPTAGFQTHANSGLATMRLQLDCNYQVCSWFGIWAKVAYCSTIDKDLRDIQDECSGADYAKYSDYAWGGVGVCLSF